MVWLGRCVKPDPYAGTLPLADAACGPIELPYREDEVWLHRNTGFGVQARARSASSGRATSPPTRTEVSDSTHGPAGWPLDDHGVGVASGPGSQPAAAPRH